MYDHPPTLLNPHMYSYTQPTSSTNKYTRETSAPYTQLTQLKSKLNPHYSNKNFTTRFLVSLNLLQEFLPRSHSHRSYNPQTAKL